MKAIFLAQWMKEKRSPYMVLIFCAISIGATLIFGSSMDTKLKINVFASEQVTAAEAEQWTDKLNESGAFLFKLRDGSQAVSDVRQGRSDMAVRLEKDDYRILSSASSMNVDLISQHVQDVYSEELRIRAAIEGSDGGESQVRQTMAEFLEQPPLTLHSSNTSGGKLKNYDMGLQLMFGFSLFLVIFTIGFKVNAITSEKISGIWNRMILSPVTKTSMYLGHLTYSSFIGMAQLFIIFTVFQLGFGFELAVHGDKLLIIIMMYIFTIVAMSMLLTGILNSPEQFGAIFTSIIPIMPLVSGIYMPPGTITNSALLLMAQIMPLKHAMDAVMGTVIYEYGWTELYLPLAKLLLMGILFFGVGINLVERRK